MLRKDKKKCLQELEDQALERGKQQEQGQGLEQEQEQEGQQEQEPNVNQGYDHIKVAEYNS
jgi:hypothetical protein